MSTATGSPQVRKHKNGYCVEQKTEREVIWVLSSDEEIATPSESAKRSPKARSPKKRRQSPPRTNLNTPVKIKAERNDLSYPKTPARRHTRLTDYQIVNGSSSGKKTQTNLRDFFPKSARAAPPPQLQPFSTNQRVVSPGDFSVGENIAPASEASTYHCRPKDLDSMPGTILPVRQDLKRTHHDMIVGGQDNLQEVQSQVSMPILGTEIPSQWTSVQAIFQTHPHAPVPAPTPVQPPHTASVYWSPTTAFHNHLIPHSQTFTPPPAQQQEIPLEYCAVCQRSYVRQASQALGSTCTMCTLPTPSVESNSAPGNLNSAQTEVVSHQVLGLLKPTAKHVKTSFGEMEKIKVYTRDSMTMSGQYALKSTNDAQMSHEEIDRRETERLKKQKQRVRSKELKSSSDTSHQLSPAGSSTETPASLRSNSDSPFEQEFPSASSLASSEDSQSSLASPVDLLAVQSPVGTVLSREQSMHEIEQVQEASPIQHESITHSYANTSSGVGGGCRIHRDPNCDEVSCVDDFFEEYEQLDENEEMRQIAFKKPTFRYIVKEDGREIAPLGAVDDPEDLTESNRALVLSSESPRRCYLDGKTREFMQVMKSFPEIQEFDGCLIHISFSLKEIAIVHEGLGLGRFSKGVPPHELIGRFARKNPAWEYYIPRIHEKLPGREFSDVKKFIDDCIHGAYEKTERILQIDLSSNPASRRSTRGNYSFMRELGLGPSGSSRNTREIRLSTELEIRDNLRPSKVFVEGSSDVMDISWSPNGQRFAIACVVFTDEYNRSGNLNLGNVETSKIRMLDGHKTTRGGSHVQVLGSDLYSTVSAVKYSNDGHLLFSGSYDKTVQIWFGEDGTHLNTIEMEDEITLIETSPIHGRVVSSACKGGDVLLLNLDEYGNELSEHTFSAPKPRFQPAALSWCNQTNPNWLMTGYAGSGNSPSDNKNGDLVVYDAKALKVAQKVTPAASGHFDVCMGKKSNHFITAVAAPKGRKNTVRSFVRLYELGGRSRLVLECDSPQLDINKITMSPCEAYLTSSGTDGCTYVWDIRFPDKILHKLTHGSTLLQLHPDVVLEEEDTGVTFASWGPSNDRLFTGGSDGKLKIWDIKSGTPFVKDMVQLDTQIMCGAFSPDFDLLMLGECSGRATMLSTGIGEGSDPELFEVDISAVDGRDHVNDEPHDGEGVRAARELIRQQKMFVRDGFAWAT